jgi:alkaline phosphatase D
MSSVRPPGLGPIVGHTTAHSCRLWIRADDPADKGANLNEDRRTIGVITVLTDAGKADPTDPSRTYYFRLRREYDRTGTFNLGVDNSFRIESEEPGPAPAQAGTLQPNKQYRVRMGTITLDDPLPNDESVDSRVLLEKLPPASVWAQDLEKLDMEKSEATFRTFPEGLPSNLSFLLGSCRYPGLLWKVKEADAIFKPMLERVLQKSDGKELSCVLMVGDQIYADMLNRYVPVGLADTYEEFQDRYLKAFGSRNMRRLMRAIPHYMILDDHEIEDNWTQDRIRDREKRMLFNLAIGAYMSYQWSHGPRTYDRRLYYTFECCGFPFFTLDLRTQRYKDIVEDQLDDNCLLGRPSPDPATPSQIDCFLAWLCAQQQSRGNVPKFVVSSSVFVPNDVSTVKSPKRQNTSDSWEAFPTTRRQILDTIVKYKIQNVVFLSGDIHCSCVAKVRFSGSPEAEKLKAFAITSSAFYWPFPFADGDPSGYVHDSQKEQDSFTLSNNHVMDYEALAFTQEDNFCQLDLDWGKKQLVVRAFGQDGKLLCTPDIDGKKGQELKTILDLAS